MTSVQRSDLPASTRREGTPTAPLPLRRLYALRFGYLFVGGGLALVKWPLLLHHDQPWNLAEGVVTCMLVALSLLALLGVRHPVRMLPVLLFEVAWKVIWLGVVALPLWQADQLDGATLVTAYNCLLGVIVLAVIPWRYVAARYVTGRGDRWLRT